jgi:hypothetical protein
MCHCTEKCAINQALSRSLLLGNAHPEIFPKISSLCNLLIKKEESNFKSRTAHSGIHFALLSYRRLIMKAKIALDNTAITSFKKFIMLVFDKRKCAFLYRSL